MVKWLLVWFICSVFLLQVNNIFASEVSIWVTPAIVGPDEPFTLSIASEVEGNETPELSPLDKNFQILSQKNSSSLSIVDGATIIKKQWNIVLLPLKKGKLEIPILKVGKRFTIPVSIEVNDHKVSAKLANSKQDIFIEVDAVPQEPYVQSQILLTQKLFHAVPIENASLSVPVIKGDTAEVLKLSSKEPYNQFIDGRRYKVIERRYALFPKHSGELLIEAAVFKGVAHDPKSHESNRLFGVFSSGRSVSVNSKTIALNVKSQSSSSEAGDWLPAKNITLFGNWSKSLKQLEVGEPVTLDLGIIADGLRAEQIPDIQLNVPEHINVYPEPPELSNNPTNSGIAGVWNQKITFIPSVEGDFEIPAFELPWWNVLNDRQEFAQLKSYQFNVKGEVTLSPVAQEPTPVGAINGQAETAFNSTRLWFFLLGVLTYLLIAYWFLDESLLKKILTKKENNKQIRKEKILAELQAGCMRGDAKRVRKILPQWALHVADISPPTLAGIARAHHGYLKTEIEELSESLYAKSRSTWNGKGLWLAIEKFPYASEPSLSISYGTELEKMYPVNQ